MIIRSHYIYAFLLLLAISSCGKDPSPDVKSILLETPTDPALKAQLFVPEQTLPPGLIFIHGPGGEAASWAGLARQCQQAGMMALTFDLPEHGANITGGRSKGLTPEQWQQVPAYLVAAEKALVAHGADPNRIAVAGEKAGANMALQFSVEHPRIQAVVLLSPGLEWQGIEAGALMQQLAKCPVLIMAAEHDAYGARSAVTLKELAPGFSEIHLYPGSASGTDLFAFSPSAMAQVLDWLQTVLSSQ